MTPIKDYALIGNCETAALINPDGGIDWLCLPTFDAGSVFARLLDETKGGDFTLHPAQPFEVEREYFENSAILQTRFKTSEGVVRLTDFFVIARKANASFYDFTSLHPTSKLVRLVEIETGDAIEMALRIRARPDYARAKADWKQVDEGAFGIKQMAVYSNASLKLENDDLLGQFTVRPGQPLFVVLDYTDERPRPGLEQIHRWRKITEAFWREWNFFNPYQGAHAALVRRSAVTMKMLTYAKSGGFVAAPTTSLPEAIGRDSNWDYRFCWVRDTALFLQTLFALGYCGEAKSFIEFICEKWHERSAKAGPSEATLDVMFPVCESPVPPETKLDHLDGYRDSRPVRFGNRALEQFQLDNYGHLLQSLFYFKHSGGNFDARKRTMTAKLTTEVITFWREEENGIWEGVEKEQFTYGKIMCWEALERAKLLLGDDDGAIQKACEEISREVKSRGLMKHNGAQILSAVLDESRFDASSLLAFTSDFLFEHDARATREAIEDELAHGPFLYRNSEQKKKEGAFVLCSFWWINHLIREGHLKRAEEILERIIEKVSPLGLLSEEIDPETGEFLGNFPQAFSHLGLIQSILNLERAKKMTGFYALPDHEKFRRHIVRTLGYSGVILGFFRSPRTATLIFSRKSKWRE